MVGNTEYNFKNESALVTGSTSGIGRGIARSFAEADANVIVNSRTEKDVEKIVEKFDKLGEGHVVGVVADLSEIDDIDRLVETAIVEFDQLDILVNNAAMWPMEDSMLSTNMEDYENTMNVNVRSQFYAAKLVANNMIESDIEGSIINISSQTGDRRTGNRGLYGISNTSINGLTWRMAGELAEYGIRMNAVSTDLTLSSQVKLEAELEGKETNQSTEEVLESWASEIPLNRLGTPEDIADAVLFLASDRATYIVGTILRVAGGGNLN